MTITADGVDGVDRSPIRVAGDGQTSSIANVITIRVQEQREAGARIGLDLRAVGIPATAAAIKAVAVARGRLATNGIDVAVVPGLISIRGNDGAEISATILSVFELTR